MAEAGTWRNGRRKPPPGRWRPAPAPPEAPPSPPPSIPLPSLRLPRPLTLPVILRAAALPLAYLLLALAGIAAGLALA
ncbi:MAG TPA: hypothetical protein VHQ00_07405, partial [Chloroflexota bacterium]|nr:hypothetical protein [Chloroflexota bacterium]